MNACWNFLEKRIQLLLGGELRGCDIPPENSWASLAKAPGGLWQGAFACLWVWVCACCSIRGRTIACPPWCRSLAAGLSQPVAIDQWSCLVHTLLAAASFALAHARSHTLGAKSTAEINLKQPKQIFLGWTHSILNRGWKDISRGPALQLEIPFDVNWIIIFLQFERKSFGES